MKIKNCFAISSLILKATTEQINTAYKNLSRVYHPDKHQDQTKKKDAEVIFNRIKTAHAVLSSPEQRAIYDLLGTKGLQTDGWELIHRYNLVCTSSNYLIIIVITGKHHQTKLGKNMRGYLRKRYCTI